MIEYRPIGGIHSPFKDIRGAPIQPRAVEGVEEVVEIFPEYAEGLKDLEGFSRIILLYHFHLVENYELLVKLYMDDAMRGFRDKGSSPPESDRNLGCKTCKDRWKSRLRKEFGRN